MSITTYSSREFTREVSAAKRASEKGPVFITDRGLPAHVLMTIAEYRKLSGTQASIAELLEMSGADGATDFEPGRFSFHPRPPDLD